MRSLQALQPRSQVPRDVLADQPLAEDPHHRQVAVQAAHEQLLRPADHERHVAVGVDVGLEARGPRRTSRTRPRRGCSSAGGGKFGREVGSLMAPATTHVMAHVPPTSDRQAPLGRPPARVTCHRRLGVTLRRTDGVDFAVYAGHADGGRGLPVRRGAPATRAERRGTARPSAPTAWFGHVPGVGAGQRYGLRAARAVATRPRRCGTTTPSCCSTRTPARSRARSRWRPEVFGHQVGRPSCAGDPDVRDDRDSAAYVPRCVVVDDGFDWEDDVAPPVPGPRR